MKTIPQEIKRLSFGDMAEIGRELRPVELMNKDQQVIGVVFLRPLSAAEVMEFAETQGKDTPESKVSQLNFVAQVLADEHGQRLIQPGEESKAGELPAALFTQIVTAINDELGLKPPKPGQPEAVPEAGGEAGKE